MNKTALEVNFENSEERVSNLLTLFFISMKNIAMCFVY
jgi:hypothetical protein